MRWYGWQIILTDAAVTGLYALAIRTDDGAPAAIASLGYLMGAPLVHAAHGQGGRGGASLVLRIAIPLTGILSGIAIGKWTDQPSSNDEIAPLVDGILGGLVGMVTASIIDATVLAYEPARREVWSPPAPAGVRLFPSLGVARAGGRGVAPVVQVGGLF
jgi:hypothetical protein